MFYSDVKYNCIDLSDAYLSQISGLLHSFWLLSNIFLKIHFQVSEDLNFTPNVHFHLSSPSYTAASGPWHLGEDGVRSTAHRAGATGNHSCSPVCWQLSDCRLPNLGLMHGVLGNRSLFFLSLCDIFFEWLIEASSHLLPSVQNFDSCNLLTYGKLIHRLSHESLPTCGPLSFPAISGQPVSLPSSREGILKER